MGQRIGRCDVIDALEEAVVFHRPIEVELQSGSTFRDRVKEVVTEQGEDWAVFVDHVRIPVSWIIDCRRASGTASA